MAMIKTMTPPTRMRLIVSDTESRIFQPLIKKWILIISMFRNGFGGDESFCFLHRIILKDSHGDQVDVLANEGGGGNSRKTMFLKAGNYAFDVQADAPWYIMMTTG